MPVFLLFLFLSVSLVLSWRNIRLSICLLILSFFVSPKIELSGVFDEIVFVRFDDLLFLAILCVTFLKARERRVIFLNAPLSAPVFAFISLMIISMISGILNRTIAKPLIALFYFLKIAEYFLIFFLVYYHTQDKESARYYLKACLLGLSAVAVYGIYEHFHPLAKVFYPGLYRIYERGFFYGQANHLAGVFAFFIPLILGAIIFLNKWRLRVILSGALLLVMLPFFWTYSRQAQLSLAASLILFGSLSLKYANYRARLIFFLALGVIVVFVFSSPLVKERILTIKETLLSPDIYSSSFTYRVNKWKLALSDTKDFLFLGSGIGSRHRAFYESQWVMFLAETGIAGIIVYLWLVSDIFKLLFLIMKSSPSDLYRGISAGFLAGLGGLIVQGFVCNVFIITVIAAPFYAVLAVILSRRVNDGL